MKVSSLIFKSVAAVLILGVGVYVGRQLFGGSDGVPGPISAILPKFTAKPAIDEKVTLSILKTEAMMFLVTKRVSTQIVVEHTESSLWGEWRGVLWATVNWRYGVDMSKLTEKDLRREGDAVVVHLPDPQWLDFAIEPGSENFMSKSTALPKMTEFFNTGQQQKILQDRIRSQAEKFARNQKLCPTREELVRQLNDATLPLKKAAGVEIRFE